MGIGFGSCNECTPPEYFRMDARLKSIRNEIDQLVNERMKPIQQKIKEEETIKFSTEIEVLVEGMDRLKLTPYKRG